MQFAAFDPVLNLAKKPKITNVAFIQRSRKIQLSRRPNSDILPHGNMNR